MTFAIAPMPKGCIQRIAQISSFVSATDASSYSHAAQDIGTAFDDRYVIVGMLARATSAVQSSAFTLGGEDCTLLARLTDGAAAAWNCFEFWGRYVKAGTTATVAYTLTTTAVRAAGIVWYARGQDLPVVGSVQSAIFTGASGDASLNVPPRGLALALGWVEASTSGSFSGDLTQNVYTVIESTHRLLGGYYENAGNTVAGITGTLNRSGTGAGGQFGMLALGS